MTVDRILVTHAGALPRSDKLNKVFRLQGLTAPVDKAALAADVKAEVVQVVRQQIECGVDSVNDGELSKSNFLFYVLDRISGITLREVDPANAPPRLDISGRDRKEFPEYFAAGKGGFSDSQNKTRMFCTTDLRYVGKETLKADLENFRNALKGVDPASAFLPALAPGTIEHWLYDEHYGDKEKFLFGIADAMAEEYRAIVEAGFILQIDDPDLPDGWQMFPEMTVAQYRDYADLRVAALNRALKGLPKEKIRLHVCWGSAHGPHHQDIPLADIIDTVFSVHAGQYSIEAANPMHEHEWRVFEKTKLPQDAILIPGVVGHCTDFIEHRELVAERLVKYAKLVGRERVMAGTDCGLGWRVGHPSIAWGKLKSMAEGAALATKELWGRN